MSKLEEVVDETTQDVPMLTPVHKALAEANYLFIAVDPGIQHVGYAAIVATVNSEGHVTNTTVVSRSTFSLQMRGEKIVPDSVWYPIIIQLSNGLLSPAFLGANDVIKKYQEVHIITESQYLGPRNIALGQQLLVAETALLMALTMTIRATNYNAVFPQRVFPGSVKSFYDWKQQKVKEPTFKIDALKKRKNLTDLVTTTIDQHQADAVWMALYVLDTRANSIQDHIKSNLNVPINVEQSTQTFAVGTRPPKGTQAKKPRPRRRKDNAKPAGGAGVQGPGQGNKQDDQVGAV